MRIDRYTLPARIRGFALATALLLVATAATNAPLFHAELKKSEPAAKAVLTAPPTELRLWFSEALTVSLSKVTLTRGKDTIPLAPLTSGKTENDPVVAKISKPATAGEYVVHWRAMPGDGHVSNGTFAFTVKK